MGNVKLKRVIVAFILISLTCVAYLNSQGLSEQLVKDQYYEIVSKVEALFSNNHKENGLFYNANFKNLDEVRDYLDSHFTETAIDKVVEDYFIEKNGRLYYEEEFQQYLLDYRDSSSLYMRDNFYSVVQGTLFNPGLKLVFEDQLIVEENGEMVVAEAKEVIIQYYDETEQMRYPHYTRYGYPPKDELTLQFTFIKEGEKLLLHDYEVNGIEQIEGT